MRLVLLAHPASLGSESMPRFAGMIQRGMTERGHEVKVWTSRNQLGGLPVYSKFIRKWLGYADQFLMYPRELKRQMNQEPADTVFVVTDQALGMWVPHLVHRPHVIHCHDFLALKSAYAEFPENPTGWTGRQYQRLILKGFSHGRSFISVSEKTRDDLHGFLPALPKISEVVYNGLNHSFRPMSLPERLSLLKPLSVEVPESGLLVHIGGNQWYKNRVGVIEIYRAFAAHHHQPPALWMIGAPPTEELTNLAASVTDSGQVKFLTNLTNEQVNAAYSHARALIFPSLGEGFGWPIVEAMAAECPVITTNIPPMTEVAGGFACLIPRAPRRRSERIAWAQLSANTLTGLIHQSESDRSDRLQKARQHSARFNTEIALAAYEKIYTQVLQG